MYIILLIWLKVENAHIIESKLEDIGFKMVIYANAPLKAAVKGAKELLQYLHGHGTTAGCEHLMISMKERNEITGLPAMEEMEQKYTL